VPGEGGKHSRSVNPSREWSPGIGDNELKNPFETSGLGSTTVPAAKRFFRRPTRTLGVALCHKELPLVGPRVFDYESVLGEEA
jgi:hypothetical protein